MGKFNSECCPVTPEALKNLIWLQRNLGTVTMANIMAATGATHVGTVTVKQITGTGTVSGDAGSGVPLSAGESWSWGVISQDQTEFLDNSTLSMNAGGGEQRITAIYFK